MPRRKRYCRYCGFGGKGLRPSVTVIGSWRCRDRDGCDRRIRVKGGFK